MDDEIKNKPDDLLNENLTDQKNDLNPKESENLSQSEGESNTEHRVIHKKSDKLHIYVRQDKYKGELKSKNWVGRTYINGKQKVSSSGTTNLDEAIPILEKWFDELQLQKNESLKQNQDISLEKDITNLSSQENTDIISSPSPSPSPSQASEEAMKEPTKGVTIGMLEKFKNFKFSKSKDNVSANKEQVDGNLNQKNKELSAFL